jgi:hypothetical protein
MGKTVTLAEPGRHVGGMISCGIALWTSTIHAASGVFRPARGDGRRLEVALHMPADSHVGGCH